MASERRLVDANVLEERVKIFDQPAWMVVRDAPTVDAVEVVRCKDCIYAELSEDGDLYCDGPIGIFGTVGFSDFCSCGERKKDGDL